MKIECGCGKFVESVHLLLVDKLGFIECTVALACITRGIDGIYSNCVLHQRRALWVHFWAGVKFRVIQGKVVPDDVVGT